MDLIAAAGLVTLFGQRDLEIRSSDNDSLHTLGADGHI